MRFYISVLFFMLSGISMAYEVPPALRDAVITVKMRDGKSTKFSANHWKVVPRHDDLPKKPRKPCPICPICPDVPKEPKIETKIETKTVEKIVEKVVYRDRPTDRRPSFGLGIGYGHNGLLKHRIDEPRVIVTPELAVVGGIYYDHPIFDNYHWKIEAISNPTIMLYLGRDL
jgi:hypothetical protein